jgi:NADH-quinone oxidoreductase subunit B
MAMNTPPEVKAPHEFVQFARLDDLLNLARSRSMWPMTFGLACCAIEMMGVGNARFDLDRFGHGVFRPSPRQCDVMIVSGTISRKMAPCIKTLYDQMPAPKYVIAHGGCASVGGPFKYPGQYGILEGIDKIIPVNVYIPGCPPRPEALIAGILELQKLVQAGNTAGTMAPAINPDFQAQRPAPHKDAMSRADFRKAPAAAAPQSATAVRPPNTPAQGN